MRYPGRRLGSFLLLFSPLYDKIGQKGGLIMFKKICPINVATNSTDFTYEYPTPRRCPMCNTGTDAQVLSAYSVERNAGNYVFILFFCHHCETCFIGAYQCYNPQSRCRNELDLIGLSPRSEDISTFSEQIEALSPKFVEIYNQSEKAETWGLNEICGIGYRKSLEFLVKDFAIFISLEDEDIIKSKPLSPCISEHIDNKRIQSLAKASAWIGNDETHYTRKHENYNISHLKAFIQAMVSFIDSELSYIAAEQLLS